MFIEVLIISLILVKIQGGDIRNLEKVHIKYWHLIVIGFLIQLLSFFFVSLSSGGMKVQGYFGLINILTYLLITLVLVYNKDYAGFKAMSLGNILNMIPMLMNKGLMPVYIGALDLPGLERQRELLLTGRIMTHSLVDSSHSFFLLADIIPIPRPYFLPKVISIGDLLLGLGLMIFIVVHSKKEVD